MEQDKNKDQINFSDTTLFKFLDRFKYMLTILLLVLGIGYLSYYTVDANEEAVILRLGKYNDTVGPGLHFRIPLIDSIYKVKVEYIYKMEFGYETISADIKTRYSKSNYEDVSWMLTKDLDIAEVKWVVQYKISDPYKYLFKVKNVEKTIMDISEAAMRMEVGDRLFDAVIGAGRESIAIDAKEYMQQKLNEYESGIKIQLVQLMPVLPPQPVQDSFEEVNRAQQDKQIYENEAERKKTKIINMASGDASKMIDEAEGYKTERINQAKGDVARFNALLKEYKKYPQITKDRIYLEKISQVLSVASDKIIIDSELDNVLPFLPLKDFEK
tara:strand:- start:271 stop:1254 length:984 start_codon:yes stop_codon:yes gene_type:complete